jgi:hypothetical protein
MCDHHGQQVASRASLPSPVYLTDATILAASVELVQIRVREGTMALLQTIRTHIPNGCAISSVPEVHAYGGAVRVPLSQAQEILELGLRRFGIHSE